MLIVDDISYSYPKKPVLHQISFKLNKGEVVALMGPSGCGKTTLFKVIGGLLSPQKGKVLCETNKLSFSYMMQDDLLLPWRTLLDNVLLGVELGQKIPSSTPLCDALELLKKMGLYEYRNQLPNQLSGGMRQRVSLARTLLQKRPLILLDEPFGALDVAHREQMRSILLDVQRKEGKTLFVITHDFHDSIALANRIFFMSGGTIAHQLEVSEEVKTNPIAQSKFLDSARQSLFLMTNTPDCAPNP